MHYGQYIQQILLRGAEHFFWQKCTDGARGSKDGANDNQYPVQDPPLQTQVFAEDLDVKSTWQDDADAKARQRSKEGHDPIKRRYDDGQKSKEYWDHDSYRDSQYAASHVRHTAQCGAATDSPGIEAEEDLESRDDRSSVQRNFGDGDNGDSDHNED